MMAPAPCSLLLFFGQLIPVQRGMDAKPAANPSCCGPIAAKRQDVLIDFEVVGHRSGERDIQSSVISESLD